MKLAVRYRCRHDGNPLTGLQHTRGNGKPARKDCRYCHGPIDIFIGLWGAFTWKGDGRYPENAALRTFTRFPAAQAFADTANGTDCTANIVIHWIPKDPASNQE